MVQALSKVLEAQHQALVKGLKHKHNHFLTKCISLASFTETEILNDFIS